jgi:hypothetical protein
MSSRLIACLKAVDIDSTRGDSTIQPVLEDERQQKERSIVNQIGEKWKMTFWKKRIWLLMWMVLLLAPLGCAPVITDGVPVNINPSFLTIAVNQTATLTVFLSKPREAAGELQISFDDPDVAKKEPGDSTVTIEPGDNTVAFQVQGKSLGRTRIYVKLGESARISSVIDVTPQ